MNYLLLAALGATTGLRGLTPIAVLCWFAYRNAIHLSGWRSFTASIIAVGIFTLAALGELYGDKQPTAPPRTAGPGLGARILMGALCAVVLAQPLVLNQIAAGVIGGLCAIAGAYIGWFVRTRTVAALKCPDLPVALTEDAITIALSITLLHLAAVHATMFAGNEGVFLR